MSRARHLRYRRFARLRRSKGFINWLARIATTLTGTGASATFTAAVSDVVTETGHGRSSGDGPFGVSSAGTLPAGLDDATPYWVEVIDANTYYLHTTPELDSRVDVTSTGSGAHSIALAAETNVDVFGLLKEHKPRTLEAATDVDSL